MDTPTAARISQLHPKVRDEVTLIVNECNKVLAGPAKVRISQGLRTIEEQDALFNQGRSKPGKIVTNARGGSSYHNYGLAVDIVLIINGKTASWETAKDYDGDKVADWMECVAIFKKYGWEWGGNFKSIPDKPHFQKTYSKTVSQLRQILKDNPMTAGGIKYPSI